MKTFNNDTDDDDDDDIIIIIIGEVRETSFLFQRCSVLAATNAVLLYNSLPASDCMD